MLFLHKLNGLISVLLDVTLMDAIIELNVGVRVVTEHGCLLLGIEYARNDGSGGHDAGSAGRGGGSSAEVPDWLD